MEIKTTKYKHTQAGYLIWYVLFGIIILFSFILIEAGQDFPLIGIMIIVLLILFSFTSLEVTINNSDLQVKFGYGIYKKRLPLRDIVSAHVVKNHWYNGWGIRIWFWPRMVIFNVSGFDAVEVKMKSGKVYRIGTNEPNILEDAINRELN